MESNNRYWLSNVNEWMRKLIPNGNLLFENKEYEAPYECLNEARGFVDGFKKNGLKFSRRNKGNTIYLSEGIEWDVENENKGGIIVFSTDVNAIKLSDNKFINFFKQKIATIMNRFKATSKIDKIANDNELVGWSIGHYLDGRYRSKNGENFGENSLAVEIIGISYERLIKIAEELCRAFQQESVLCKSWENGKILFINSERENQPF